MRLATTECLLKPGEDHERPLTFVVRSVKPDEDGSRACVEMDLSLEEAEDLARDLRRAAAWVKSGVWKPGPANRP